MTTNLCRKIIVFTACLLTATVNAASKEEIMSSRYLKYQFCMERTFGQAQDGHGIYNKIHLETVMNQWGSHEPKQSSIERATEAVKKADLKCRKDNQIDEEARPQ